MFDALPFALQPHTEATDENTKTMLVFLSTQKEKKYSSCSDTANTFTF